MEEITKRDRKIIAKAKDMHEDDIKKYITVSRVSWLLSLAVMIFGVVDYFKNSGDKGFFLGMILYVIGVFGMQYYKAISVVKKLAEKHNE